jgi:uncharacterized integral membrane protein
MDENEPRQELKPGSENTEAKRPDNELDEAWQPQLWSKLILLLVVVGYGIALVVANSSKVKISFLFASINVSKIWLILLCLVLGLVSGVLISQVYRHRKNERAQLERQAEQAKKA